MTVEAIGDNTEFTLSMIRSDIVRHAACESSRVVFYSINDYAPTNEPVLYPFGGVCE